MSGESQKNYSGSVELSKKIIEEIEEVAKEKKLNKEERKRLEEEVYKKYLESKFEPGEAIGIISAQSISEPATQMSCSANEKILIKDKGIKIFEIGKFIDQTIEKFGAKKIGNSEVCDLPRSVNFYALSLNENEKVEWKRIIACIRHKSPERLIKITTRSNRKIVATDHHSFIIRKDNKIVPIAGSELRIGDRIPVIKFLPENCNYEINVLDFLNCNKYFAQNGSIGSKNTKLKSLPEKMVLDNSFGWFIGAYLSEGSSSNGHVRISNLNEDFLTNAENFVKKMGIGYKIHLGELWPRKDFIINSSLLGQFITHTCSKSSKNKKVPEFAYSAPEGFVSSLLRGYFDGDGNITISRKMIKAHSDSEELIDGIKLLLTRFGIFAYKSKDKKQFYLLIPYKYAPIFLEKIGSDIKEKKEKLKKLSKLAKIFNRGKSQDFTDMISGFGDLLYRIAKKLKYPTKYVNSFTKRQKIGRTTLYRYIKLFERLARERKVNIFDEMKILKRMFNSDVVWDEITEITYVKPSSEYVYDISVDGLETFTTFDGIITHNTMRTYHFAGAAGIKVTYGLPRLIEIFDAKREPETPMMTIYLKKEFSNVDDAKRIAEEIVEKKISHLLEKIYLNLNEGTIELDLLDRRKENLIIKVLKENFKDIILKVKGGRIVIAPKSEIKMKELLKLREKILRTYVSGVKGIENAVIRREDNNWIINTIGSNLEKILQLEEVDSRKTITNNIHETARVLGIEAARNLIIREATKTLQEQGLDVDIRHVMLVGDIMTLSGEVNPIGRYGVAGAKTSVFARAVFEETIKHLVRASIRNEVDDFKGIFENVMIGQVIPSGTGMFDLVAKFEEEKEEK